MAARELENKLFRSGEVYDAIINSNPRLLHREPHPAYPSPNPLPLATAASHFNFETGEQTAADSPERASRQNSIRETGMLECVPLECVPLRCARAPHPTVMRVSMQMHIRVGVLRMHIHR